MNVVLEPLTDPLEVIPLPLKLYSVVGVSRQHRERRRLYAVLSYVVVCFFIPKLCLGYDNIPQGFRGTAECLFALNTCIPLVFLPFKLDKFEELIQGLQRCIKAVSESVEFTHIVVKLNTAIHKFTKFYFLFTIWIVIAMTTSTVCGVIYIYLSHTPGETMYIPLIMEYRFYALDCHRNIHHFFLHSLLLTPTLYILVVAFTAKAGAFFGSIRFCSTIFQILNLKIEKMRIISSADRYLEELKHVIELHQLTINCTELLQEILMYILLAQFTGCVIIWCFFLYYVMVSAEQISSSMYASNWYEQPVGIQKLIIPVIQKAQRKVGITAAKFYYVDVSRYGKDAQMNKITRLYLTALLVPANFYSYSPILSTLWKYYSGPINGTDTQFILHMEENFYGLAIRTSLSHYLIFGAIMVPTSFLCAIVGTAKLVSILSLIRYCTIYFQLVTLKLRDTAGKQYFSHDVRSIVRMHEGALNCAELLKILTAPILLLQLILCVLVWSSMLLYFTVSSSLVAQAVYDNGWETQSSAVQKELQLVLLRAQKPVGITAGKFCYMNMEQFGEIVKTTYSFFVIVRDHL
uniref:Uncharacterized protein n=1 Tax=Anopheles atroparvus TaxID=41427 RepID=A0A182JFC9_ANOAO